MRFGPLLAFALGCVASGRALAQYDVEEPSRVWLRALLDVRIANGGPRTSWTEGGAGRTRYGGKSVPGGFERDARLALAHLSLEAGAALPWGIRAQAQVSLQPDAEIEDEPRLIEALLRREWGAEERGFGLQAGLTHLPFSLEHGGPGWTPERSLSASALNSWLWEEMPIAGVEAEWWRSLAGLELGLLAGAGYGPDQTARLLALRGWALGDVLAGAGSEYFLPGARATIEVFDERDDRPAAYVWLTLGDSEDRAGFSIGHFDNFGDQEAPGVWQTRFSTVALALEPRAGTELVLQYLDGEARVRDTTNDSALGAYYALLSHRRGRHRVSLRYEAFRLDDRDGGNPTRERGEGLTLAWLYEWGLRHRIGLEHVWLESRRGVTAAPSLSHDGWQLSYRFRY